MKKALLIGILFALVSSLAFAQAKLKITSPKEGEVYRVGRTSTIKWDTLDLDGNRTWNKTFEFKWAESPNGPWSLLPVAKNKKDFKDVDSRDTNKAAGQVITVYPRKETLYIKMQLKSDTTLYGIAGPFSVYMPPPATPDSLLEGKLTTTVTLSPTKIYGLKKVFYVGNGGVLRILPGTVILGDPENVSAICVNRGGKIYANGTPEKPIIMTSGYAVGSRDRGDWGGLLIMGNAETNLIEAAIEGGIADDANTRENAWFGRWNGVNNDDDSSGVVRYVRIEFAGIAESPDNELNSLTLGAVGRKTIIENVMVSYAGDDAYEWFGGTVNAKRLISYNTIDDDLDTDNGYSGKVQYALIVRVPDVADQSNSEAFESDNDSKSSENQPFTRPVFSNITAIGPVRDTSWTVGTGTGKYHSKFLTAVQIRRNSRMSLFNSVIAGWPAGVELTNQNTVRAADNDSVMVRFNDFYGVKNNKWFYFGSGTQAQGKVTADWLATTEYGNVFKNDAGWVGSYAQFQSETFALPNGVSPKDDASYLTTARWDVAPLQDPFFDKVQFRGAFGRGIIHRWDLPWAEYDPVWAEYKAEPNTVEETKVDPVNIYKIAPVPAQDFVNIIYNIEDASNVTIKLYDATGKEISTIAQNLYQMKGYYEFAVDLKNFPTGTYFVQIQTDKGVITRQFVVVK